MEKSIRFSNFRYKPRRVDLDITVNETDKKNIFFEINRDYDFENSSNELAMVFASICGKNYENVDIDLRISKRIYDEFCQFTESKVKCAGYCEEAEEILQEKYILNFSGGIDSLAALCLMPENTDLVAVDFGKRFQREKDWFDKFNPICVTTNFREEKFDRNSWTFMGCGAVIAQKICKAKYNVFGTILEATKYQFQVGGGSNAQNALTKPFSPVGFLDARITNGLTEVGTMMLVEHYKCDSMDEALKSLSYPKTEKRYRKQALASIVAEKMKYPLEIEITEPPEKKVEFGTNYALDFLALYIMKNKGIEEAEKTVCNIPKSYCELAKASDLTFYERYNTNFLKLVPENYRKEFMGKLLEAGILPYTEIDWLEFRKVAEYIDNYEIEKKKLLENTEAASFEQNEKKREEKKQEEKKNILNRIKRHLHMK